MLMKSNYQFHPKSQIIDPAYRMRCVSFNFSLRCNLGGGARVAGRDSGGGIRVLSSFRWEGGGWCMHQVGIEGAGYTCGGGSVGVVSGWRQHGAGLQRCRSVEEPGHRQEGRKECGTVRARKPASAAVHTSNTSYTNYSLSHRSFTQTHIILTFVLPGSCCPACRFAERKNPKTTHKKTFRVVIKKAPREI